MRQPLWILNSILFGVIIIILFFILFSRVTVEKRASIEPDLTVPSVVKEASTINIKKIYEQDIFGTYIKRVAQPKEQSFVTPAPPPPRSTPIRIPESPDPKFLDPLNVTLKGIISIGDGTQSSAIISDNKTKREAVYKVGDFMEDAQLIRIFNKKIIFVRSNGQQEVFYLRERDAQNDPTFLNIDDWNGIVKKTKPNNYIVSPVMFVKRVKNLAQFIDLLGLTSAYHKGKSIGCRVGDLAEDSLGDKLGFKSGDIVLSIEGIAPTATKKRLEIYKKITGLGIGDTVVVRLQRRRNKYTLRYELNEFRPAVKIAPLDLKKVSVQQVKEEQKKMLEKKYKFAPTARDIRQQERKNMFRRGGRPGARR